MAQPAVRVAVTPEPQGFAEAGLSVGLCYAI